MAQPSAPGADVIVVGGGLAGSILALELAGRGAAVLLLGSSSGATALSYGGVPWWGAPPGPLDEQMVGALACWQRLEHQHGPLGLESCALRLHWSEREEAGEDVPAALAAVEALAGRHLPAASIKRQGRTLCLPYARVDARTLSAALPRALKRAGVRREAHAVVALQKLSTGWRAVLADDTARVAAQLVLAAGAGCRALWPELPPQLRVSWAGVFCLERWPAEVRLPPDHRDIHMPLLGRRHSLEAQANDLRGEQWIVDPGMAPWGDGLLLGQTSLVRPGLAVGAPPDPAALQLALGQALDSLHLLRADGGATLWRAARFHQVPVSFCTSGTPLAGPVQGAPGLWAFAGFGGPFALVPPLAPRLAAALSGGS